MAGILLLVRTAARLAYGWMLKAHWSRLEVCVTASSMLLTLNSGATQPVTAAFLLLNTLHPPWRHPAFTVSCPPMRNGATVQHTTEAVMHQEAETKGLVAAIFRPVSWPSTKVLSATPSQGGICGSPNLAIAKCATPGANPRVFLTNL